jgi:hypothetical protein
MTTLSMKKTCVRCVKGGTGIVTCDGCLQSFCHKHLAEHRAELLEQMNSIDDQCEHVRQSIAKENDPSPILSAIDHWEQQSIDKIRLTADNARDDVHKSTERTLDDFNIAINNITTKIQSSREANDGTESDIKKWNEQLKILQDLLKEPFPISLITDEKAKTTINIIKVKYEPPVTDALRAKLKFQHHLTSKKESHSPDSKHITIEGDERFGRGAGHVTLSDDDSVATFVGYSSICGKKLYSSGTQRIRFRIIAQKNEGIFFGVMSSKHAITARASELPSVYGWRDFDRPIMNGNAQLKSYKERNIEPGDRLTLTVDCTNSKLTLTHHQLEGKIYLSIDSKKCPLPWKLLVSSFGDDVIAIVH